MNAPHRIRLHGPWLRWLATDHVPAPTRIRIPEEDPGEALAAFTGTLLFSRRFHRPLRMPASEVVHLVFDGLGGDAEVRLNEVLLGTSDWPAQSVRFDLTGRLQPTNLLQVELRRPAADVTDRGKPPKGCLGAVHLSFGDVRG